MAKLSRASCQQYQSMTATVPATVSTPANRVGRAWETVVEMFSMSLLIRLMTSPWEWVSRYWMGRSTILSKSSSRIRRTIRWLSRALMIRWRNWEQL